MVIVDVFVCRTVKFIVGKEVLHLKYINILYAILIGCSAVMVNAGSNMSVKHLCVA